MLVLGVAGCATTAPTSSPVPATAASTAKKPAPLQLVESGFTVVEGPYVEYGVIIKNPNEDIGAVFPAVRITMRDEAGGVLGTDDQTLNRIMPGGVAAWGGQADPNGKKPAKVEFEVLDPGDTWKLADQMEPADFKPFTVIGLRANKSDSGTSFTGELVNPNSSAFNEAAVSVLLRDKAGAIVGGYTGFIERLPANGKAAFEVSSMGDVPAYASIEAYPSPW